MGPVESCISFDLAINMVISYLNVVLLEMTRFYSNDLNASFRDCHYGSRKWVCGQDSAPMALRKSGSDRCVHTHTHKHTSHSLIIALPETLAFSSARSPTLWGCIFEGYQAAH